MKISQSAWLLLLAISMAVGCAAPKVHNLPPAQRLLEPGPGVGGPGPGVLPPALPPMVAPVAAPTVQILFSSPEALQVHWDITGSGQFDSVPLVVPGRSNFPQAGIYRLKLTNIPGREGVELYPTLEVGPTTPRTEAFLAHNAVPVQFTEEDFDQVLAGNFVTKVIYLPDPEFQQLALAGVETLVSTRLDAGVDPIVEADRRGAIMAIVRLGNKDVEMPGAEMEGGVIQPVTFDASSVGNPACYGGVGGPGAAGMPPQFVAGVTAPQWGMPMSGTPIGLPGPPHVPLGVPAGLQSHVMKNHTKVHMPPPTEKLKIHVKHQPGYSYPRPADRMWVKEQTIHPPLPPFGQPHADAHQHVH